jgi:hypothetical protein
MRGRIRFGENGDADRYFLDGREVGEAEFREAFPDRPIGGGTFGGTPTSGWPILSDALGVHPKQREEHERLAREKGVPTETLPDGRVVLTDRAHRKRYLRAFGFHDKSGGYGD